MEQSISSAEADISQVTVRSGTLPTESSIPDQAPTAGLDESLVVPVTNDDCDSGTPPARSSFDSLLILPESAAAPSAQGAPRMRPRQLCYWLSTQNPWFLETLNAVLLLVAISAIVATLYIHAGQPLPHWPFDITINAMLSIYAVVLKASMAFIQTSCIGQLQWSWFSTSSRSLHDLVKFHDAGQGPLGSFSWLWTYRLRQPIAALGASIIVVAMAVDPFVQQLIQPVDCMEQVPGAPVASVPTTNVITYGDMPGALEPSIVSGLYTRQNLTDFECITGNCTFTEDYTTIGFCSSCEDVSNKLTITTNCTVITNQSVTPHQGPCDGWLDGSEGASIPVIWNITTAYPPFNLTFYHNWMNSTAVDEWFDEESHGPYQDDTPDVFTMKSSPRWVADLLGGHVYDVQFGVDLGVIYGMSDNSIYRHEPTNSQQNLTGCGDASSNNTWYCRGYGAATCLMQPCLKTYSAGVQAGRLIETLVEHTDPAADWGYSQLKVDGAKFIKGYFGLVDKRCISHDQHQQLAAAGYDSVGDSQARWLPYKTTYDPTHPNATTYNFTTYDPTYGNATTYNATLSSSLLASRCLFLVDELFVDGIWEQALNNFLLGTVKCYSTGYDPLSPLDIGRVSFMGPDPVRYVWSSGRVNMTGINETMANLAQALTLWVAWAWIALPAVLTALTLLVLAATVVATARDQVPVWKSSPLTLLFHGPGGRYWVDEGLVATENAKESDGEDIGTKRGMEKFSARVSVKLGDNGGHGELRLRQVSAVSQNRS